MSEKISNIKFYKGNLDILEKIELEMDRIKKIQEHLADAMGAQNLSFLFGSGCSSHIPESSELGISTMYPLAKEYVDTNAKKLENEFGIISIDASKYADNLEKLMNILFSSSYYFIETNKNKESVAVKTIIDDIKKFLFNKCFKEEFLSELHPIVSIYRMFYKKLSYRDKNLVRPWIFTTNYDLFNELALDSIGVPYTNGFSGIINRCFNPATFRYSLSQELGLSSKKWTTVDSYIYLCKLHGSINWIEKGEGLFPIKEMQKPQFSEDERMMIYPTPLKQNASFSSPYSDLFREFQTKLLQEQSILLCVGYSFGDEHVNNIIYRALTIPTFRLIIFSNPDADGEIKKLRELKDPRIWIIGSDPRSDKKVHYFYSVVNTLLPGDNENTIESATEAVVKALFPKISSQLKGAIDDK